MMEAGSISSIYKNLQKSMNQCKDEMMLLQYKLSEKLDSISQIKCKCRTSFQQSLSTLKQTFEMFSNEWKVQLPLILNEFVEIVGKVSFAYQQKIKQINEEKEKWKFSYQQLLTSFSPFQKQEEALSELMGKEAEESMMQSKITELFSEEDSFREKQSRDRMPLRERSQSNQNAGSIDKGKCKMLEKISLDNSRKRKQSEGRVGKQNSDKSTSKLLNLRKSFFNRHRNSYDWKA